MTAIFIGSSSLIQTEQPVHDIPEFDHLLKTIPSNATESNPANYKVPKTAAK
ncbi:MAG: hypothetical protein Q4C95_07205 [Planctomycetia bacterium]|nr:hypothetical protein [Planctomycetia bacterium]